jgi:signal transduction histidine kinase
VRARWNRLAEQGTMDVMTTPGTREQSELLSLTVHELRTPVTVVAGYLRMLARGQLGAVPEQQQKVIEEAERSCGRLKTLLDEMSELANFDGPDPPRPTGEVAIAEMLDRVAASAPSDHDRGVEVVRTGSGEEHIVRADRKRLMAALSALVSALVREQREPGRIAVHLETRQRNGQPVAHIFIGREDATDMRGEHGPGAQFNESPGGLGLALPLARRVIERAGGLIWSSHSAADGKKLGAVTVQLPLLP